MVNYFNKIFPWERRTTHQCTAELRIVCNSWVGGKLNKLHWSWMSDYHAMAVFIVYDKKWQENQTKTQTVRA